ncbi:unnamed protein product [Orchesella dallaii]|uniref:Secreted protein n=1 Tax=Orchesella dallaii TaxID=48710 RepID=A0ABP1QFH1_9HEXA
MKTKDSLSLAPCSTVSLHSLVIFTCTSALFAGASCFPFHVLKFRKSIVTLTVPKAREGKEFDWRRK